MIHQLSSSWNYLSLKVLKVNDFEGEWLVLSQVTNIPLLQTLFCWCINTL